MKELITIIKKALIEGYATSDIRIGTILICVVCTLCIAAYICAVYKVITKKDFYNKSFSLSLLIIALITAAIILTIQSNIVVSLGMVGALSIVRFRTAIKDPMDLAFLFWAISAGIICGAGFALIAVIVSLVITLVIVLYEKKSDPRRSLLLVVDADDYTREKDLLDTVGKRSSNTRVRARNASKSGINIVIEIASDDPDTLIREVLDLDYVTRASLVEHDGNTTA